METELSATSGWTLKRDAIARRMAWSGAWATADDGTGTAAATVVRAQLPGDRDTIPLAVKSDGLWPLGPGGQWTTGHARISATPPAGYRVMSVAVAVRCLVASVPMQIRLDDAVVFSGEVLRGAWRKVFPATSTPLNLEISTATFVPALHLPGSIDQRHLGVFLQEVTLSEKPCPPAADVVHLQCRDGSLAQLQGEWSGAYPMDASTDATAMWTANDAHVSATLPPGVTATSLSLEFVDFASGRKEFAVTANGIPVWTGRVVDRPMIGPLRIPPTAGHVQVGFHGSNPMPAAGASPKDRSQFGLLVKSVTLHEGREEFLSAGKGTVARSIPFQRFVTSELGELHAGQERLVWEVRELRAALESELQTTRELRTTLQVLLGRTSPALVSDRLERIESLLGSIFEGNSPVSDER